MLNYELFSDYIYSTKSFETITVPMFCLRRLLINIYYRVSFFFFETFIIVRNMNGITCSAK